MNTGGTSIAKSVPKRRRNPVAARHRTYLYAVVADARSRRYGDFGIDGSEVYSIPEGQVAAAVSNLRVQRVWPERSHLAAHEEVLKKLMAETTPLPMSFGVLADSLQAVRNLFSRNQRALLEQLQRVASKVEMGVRVTCDVPNIFEYFLNTHPELRRARDEFLGGPRESRQWDKIEVGRMFDHLLEEDRKTYADQVKAVLAPHCAAIGQGKCCTEREVMNLACLVERPVLP
jgi:hypothetical protein